MTLEQLTCTPAKLAAMVAAERNRTIWGEWEYSHRTDELTHRRRRYCVDLATMRRSPDACLDGLMQTAAKRWMTPADAKHLLDAVASIINPQATLCSGALARTREMVAGGAA
jgi:hypothetical protein